MLIARSTTSLQLLLSRILESLALKFLEIINKKMRDLKNKFGTDDIPIENYGFPKIFWKLKIQKSLLRLDIQ